MRIWLAILVSIAGSVCFSAGAEKNPVFGQDGKREFAIPSEPLDRALDRFSETTGYRMIYETSIIGGRQSGAVVGTYGTADALRLLLRGTGLAAKVEAAETFSVVLPPPEDGPLFYYGILQTEIMASLCNDVRTRPGLYRKALQVVVDVSGHVSTVKLLGQSEDANRDAAIVEVITNIRLPPPPPSMQDAVTVVIEKGRRDALLSCP